MYQIDLTEEPERLVFGVLHVGPYPEMGPAYGRLMDLAAEHGLMGIKRELLGIFHDDPDTTPPERLRSHAGITLPPDTALPPGLERLVLRGGRYARLRLRGPYAGLPAAYAWLYGTGLAEAGLTPANAPSFEVYPNDPMTAAPADLLTDIHVPLD